jgi:hypothetical protein
MMTKKIGALVTKAQELAEAILSLKDGIAETIKGLPENPDINIIDKRCFTIKFSQLSADTCLSPEFYRFEFQYKALADMIKRSKAENVLRKLNEALADGWVYLSSERTRRVRLHPAVVANVKGIM